MIKENSKKKLNTKTLEIISISFGFIISFFILEIIARLAPATDIFPLEKPIVCDLKKDITIRCLHSKKPFSKGIWSAGKLTPFNIKASKITNDIGQFSNINFKDFKKERENYLNIISIGDSIVEAIHVENKFSFHGLLNEKKTNNNQNIISTSIGSAGMAFPNYIMSINYAKRFIDLEKSIVILTITPNDFYESFLKYGKKGRRRGLGQFFFQENSKDFLFIPYEKNRNLTQKLTDSLIENSALTRYLVYNLRLGEVIKKNVSFFNQRQSEIEQAQNESKKIKEISKYTLGNIAKKEFFEQMNRLRPTNNERKRTLLIISYLGSSIYDKIDPKIISQEKLMVNSFINQAKKEGYSVLDMKPIFLADYSRNNKKFNSPYDAHWNEYGHFVVAENILKQINLIEK